MLVHNLLKKNTDKVHSWPQFTVNCPSWWNSTDQQVPQSLCKNISLKVESSHHLYHGAKQFGLQLPDQESSSTQSIGESQHEVAATQGTNSQDQCILSESGQDGSCDKYVGDQSKPVFLPSNTDFMFNPSQVDYSFSMARVPYPYSDPYFGALMTSYGPHAIIQPQMVGIGPARVPLPLDHAADGPIYVNAKQYHGILRRRQSRAKLEAQNKVIKARKSYLHESRHRHALNRVRGSGGRFLPAKKLQQTDPTPTTTTTTTTHCASNALHFETCYDITSVPTCNVSLRQPDIMVGAAQCSDGYICSGTQHTASIVR